jgi:hypothetical protein
MKVLVPMKIDFVGWRTRDVGKGKQHAKQSRLIWRSGQPN